MRRVCGFFVDACFLLNLMTMNKPDFAAGPLGGGFVRLFAAVMVVVLACPGAADAQKRRKPAAPKLPELKTHEDKLRMLGMIEQQFTSARSRSYYDSDDLTEDLDKFIKRGTSTPISDPVDDVTFLRRVTFDLTGRAPTIGEIRKFEADKSPTKRADVVDRLVGSDAWARKLARYWRSVVFYDSPGQRNTTNPQAFEDWLFEQFKAGRGWGDIVAEMVFATPERKKGAKVNENGWNQDFGPNNFVLASNREPEQLAARTARLFMGISIECAECHDHPFDNWKREQFHELAAFFSPNKYYMDDAENPSERHLMQAKFLLGEKPAENLKSDQRRVVIAAYLIYNPDNYWFARAFVNRVWSEMLGDGFYAVDSLGPDGEAVHQIVVNKIAAQFRAKDFDVAWLYKLIANSDIYQRQTGAVRDTADLFTTVRATRLRPYEVADRVSAVTGGKLDGRTKGQLASTFDQNPSVPHADLEGSVQQALILMNSGGLYASVLKRDDYKELAGSKDTDKIVETAFLDILARRPSDEEAKRYRDYFRTVGNAKEALEDLVWVLVNSAEFLTKT